MLVKLRGPTLLSRTYALLAIESAVHLEPIRKLGGESRSGSCVLTSGSCVLTIVLVFQKFDFSEKSNFYANVNL